MRKTLIFYATATQRDGQDMKLDENVPKHKLYVSCSTHHELLQEAEQQLCADIRRGLESEQKDPKIKSDDSPLYYDSLQDWEERGNNPEDYDGAGWYDGTEGVLMNGSTLMNSWGFDVWLHCCVKVTATFEVEELEEDSDIKDAWTDLVGYKIERAYSITL